MLTTVSQGLRFLLELSQLLKMMRRQAHQMALAGHGDLQRLPDPPRGISGESCAMAHIETVDGLHQSANRFLEQIRITQGMVAKALGHMGGQTYVSRC